MFSILLQTARSIQNSLIAHFSNNFNSVFYKKSFMKLIGAVAVKKEKKKEQIGFSTEYSISMIKIHYIFP